MNAWRRFCVAFAHRFGWVDVEQVADARREQSKERIKTFEQLKECEAALEEFVGDIERSGGVIKAGEAAGMTIYEPIADRDWTDLGASYINACRALGRKPQITND